jgi:hypothetical protein
MPIIEISKQQFDALNVAEHCTSLWASKHEKAWFRDDTSHVLGVLHVDQDLHRWGYSICVHGGEGDYHRVALGVDIPGEALARSVLTSAMVDFDGAPPAPDRVACPA